MVGVGGTEDLEFKWGKKKRIGEPLPYLGKLIKIWETADKSKKVKVLWFFQPSDISNYLVDELAHPKEIFLASGEGAGLANINPLEAIGGRCNVVCISKDSRNPQPSDRDLKMADFVFYRTFDVGLLTIMDNIDEKIAGTEGIYFLLNLFLTNSFLKPSSVHNFSVDDKNASEKAMEINGRMVLSKLNSSENQIPEDDRQEEQKPAVAEKLAPNDRQENGFKYKSASSFEVEENSDLIFKPPHTLFPPWKERMPDAHEHGKLVLFQNMDPTYSSADVEDIVWTAFKKTCRAKVVQQTAYSSPHSGQAFAIFNTREVAEGVVTELDKGCLLLPNQRYGAIMFDIWCYKCYRSAFSVAS
ncbi:Bromo-adjacent domain-containing protein, putative isoform 2 [Hibiscus syriacus]|uniref:Bromo-adjacent domain-containing protein, putative isoform 2 n=1 Tax=Hibiscus syriacus TaxID=106335 RepID=A0A6A2YTF2_HIBSY|nr:Bromo-adjacent domain-containing protein, putative isoform 2 [Hibiscus syriacus]